MLLDTGDGYLQQSPAFGAASLVIYKCHLLCWAIVLTESKRMRKLMYLDACLLLVQGEPTSLASKHSEQENMHTWEF